MLPEGRSLDPELDLHPEGTWVGPPAPPWSPPEGQPELEGGCIK